MTNQHSQKLLSEIKSPTHAGRKEGEAAILAFLPVLSQLAHQAAEERALVQLAEISEEDDELRSRFELYAQTAGAQQGICTKIEKEVRDLMTTLRQRERYDADIRPVAVAKGYAG